MVDGCATMSQPSDPLSVLMVVVLLDFSQRRLEVIMCTSILLDVMCSIIAFH